MSVRILFTFLFTYFLNLALYAQSVPTFTLDDKVCFLGNSITHSGSYHKYIYLYHLTRKPFQSFGVINAGIAGDIASGGRKRLRKEVLDKGANIVAVMFGMNDVKRWLYEPTDNTDSLDFKRREALETYFTEMDSLIWELKQEGITPILMTPTIFDQEAPLSTPNLLGVNDALSVCSIKIKELAQKYSCSVVDLHKGLYEYNKQWRQQYPTSTVIGEDRVHPGAMGHFLMAYLFLQAQQEQTFVAKIKVNAHTREINVQNSHLTNLKRSEADITFQYQAFSLPFPMDSSAIDALTLIPFQNELNQEILQISNLAYGDYQLKIDEQVIDTVTSIQMNIGINLADYSHTPQYQQALEVANLNQRRHQLVSDTLRCIAMIEFTHLEGKAASNDMDEIRQTLESMLEGIEGKPWYNWVASEVQKYLQVKPYQKMLLARKQQLEDELWKINHPRLHTVEITAISSDDK